MEEKTKQKIIELREFLKNNKFELLIDSDSIEYGVCDDISADWELSYLENDVRQYIKRGEINKL